MKFGFRLPLLFLALALGVNTHAQTSRKIKLSPVSLGFDLPDSYKQRTFIKPTQNERNMAVRLKLNIIDELVRGKRLVIVDDSIVRGTTTKAKMDQLRAAGAKEIHLRISCPPIRHPCYFGVDFAERSQLIAYQKGSVEAIRDFLGV